MTYIEKLKSPEWQKKRLEILKRDEFTCKMCNSKDKQLHVHHKFYIFDKDPWSYDNQSLITLCYDCHEQEEHYKFFINQDIKYYIYKGLTYTELHQDIVKLLGKYKETLNCTFDENFNFYNNV